MVLPLLIVAVVIAAHLTWNVASLGNLTVYALFYGQPGVNQTALLETLLGVVPTAPWVGPWLLCVGISILLPFLLLTGYFLIDHHGWWERYRVNRREWLSPSLIRAAYRKLYTNRLRMMLETLVLFAGTAALGYWSPERCATMLSTVPTRLGHIQDLTLALAIFETMFYWIHRWEHRYWYSWHKAHHEFHSTLPIAAIWGSRRDAVLTSIVPFILPMILVRFHLLTCYMWMIIHYAHTWIDHSGYQLPFHPLQLVPFANHVREHEQHHQKVDGNYGLFWTTWDIWMGTTLSRARRPDADTSSPPYRDPSPPNLDW